MGNWEALILVTQFDDGLVAEFTQNLGDAMPTDLHELITGRIDSKKDIAQIRKALKEYKRQIPNDLASRIEETLREIYSDIEYVKTDLGKTVLAINRWMAPWYQSKIQNDPDLDGVFIGGNSEQLFKIFVSGRVRSAKAQEKLRKIIHDQKPPFEVIYNIQIND